jgi:hypothetical protein
MYGQYPVEECCVCTVLSVVVVFRQPQERQHVLRERISPEHVGSSSRPSSRRGMKRVRARGSTLGPMVFIYPIALNPHSRKQPPSRSQERNSRQWFDVGTKTNSGPREQGPVSIEQVQFVICKMQRCCGVANGGVDARRLIRVGVDDVEIDQPRRLIV